MASTFKTIIKELKKQVYHPVYFLTGDEPYYIDKVTDFIESSVLTDSEKEFNQTIVYGKEVDLSTVISTAKRYPMMANYQVVIVKEAQEMKDLFSKSTAAATKSKGSESDKNLLLSYLENPQATTLLVFCYKYKSVDGRTKLGKTLMKDTVFLKSAKMYDDKLPDWILGTVEDRGYSIGSKAAQMLANFLGNDLLKISNEIDKVTINIKDGEEITPELIEKFIGISKDYNIFEFQDAIGNKNIYKANQIIKYFGNNPKACPFPVAISILYTYFNRLISYHALMRKGTAFSRSELASKIGINPFFLKDIEKASRNFPIAEAVKTISILHEYDLRSKGVGNISTDHSQLLREMTYKILHSEIYTPA